MTALLIQQSRPSYIRNLAIRPAAKRNYQSIQCIMLQFFNMGTLKEQYRTLKVLREVISWWTSRILIIIYECFLWTWAKEFQTTTCISSCVQERFTQNLKFTYKQGNEPSMLRFHPSWSSNLKGPAMRHQAVKGYVIDSDKNKRRQSLN